MTDPLDIFPKVVGAPSEQEMRDTTAPTPKTLEELSAYVESLVMRNHDYGTCCYAMSLAATAAFNYVAQKLGVTGFQASCADLDILRRTRGLENFKVVNYHDLLYPHHCTEDRFPSWGDLMEDPKIRGWLREKAVALLAKNEEFVAPMVKLHWEQIAAKGRVML